MNIDNCIYFTNKYVTFAPNITIFSEKLIYIMTYYRAHFAHNLSLSTELSQNLNALIYASQDSIVFLPFTIDTQESII